MNILHVDYNVIIFIVFLEQTCAIGGSCNINNYYFCYDRGQLEPLNIMILHMYT